MIGYSGVRLTLLVGPTVPVPAPPAFLEALESIEVRHSDSDRSGFQLRFLAGRSGAKDLRDYALVASPLLKPFNRVVITVTIGPVPRVLFDGIITNTHLAPGSGDAPGSFTVTGVDVSVMMDLEEKSVEHPGQSENVIATKIIGTYAQYGLVPVVVPPVVLDQPVPTERTPVQQGTDLAYLDLLARRHGHVFYVTPGPSVGVNTAYWGPPVRVGAPQRALTVDSGAWTNVDQIDFGSDALRPTLVTGSVQDRSSNQSVPVQTFASTRLPLAAEPALAASGGNARKVRFRDSGLNVAQSLARAQATTDASTDEVVTASGTLDAVRYGDVLRPRALVDVRGVGHTHNGTYYVKSVNHSIRKGSYKQSFTLTREGTGALLPVVVP